MPIDTEKLAENPITDEGFRVNLIDVLNGTVEAPVMPGHNPFPIWTDAWFAWKEVKDNYVPYHIKCSRMPRVRKIDEVTFKCPACHVTFPTSSSQLDPELLQAIKDSLNKKD